MTTLNDVKQYEVAIVIPIGPGHRPWLESSIKSIACQNADVGIAICACEDSSSLQDLIKRYRDIITYVRIGPDNGQSAAVNEGWRNVSAKIYSWLNDDDMLHPNALEHVLSCFKETNCDVVHGISDIWKDGTITPGYGNSPVTESLLRDNVIAQPSTFVQSEALSKVQLEYGPLAEDRHFTMDWDLWQRLYQSGAKFAAIDRPLSLTRWYKETKTGSASLQKYKEYAALLKRNTSTARLLWSLTNIFLHNQSIYGHLAPLFRNVTRFLFTRHQTPAPLKPKEMELFHFEDTPQIPHVTTDEQDIALEPLQPGEVLSTAAHSARFSAVHTPSKP